MKRSKILEMNTNVIDIKDYLDGDRLLHSLKVKAKAVELADKYKLSDYNKKMIEIAAELHDIGYSDKVQKITNFHPLDGYLFLRGKVHDTIAATVLLHSCADELVEFCDEFVKHYFKSNIITMRKADTVNKTYIDIVSMADMLIDAKGRDCTSIERYEDMVSRYGEDDYRTEVFAIQMRKYSLNE